MVLYGGQSAEHDISCISALNVLKNLDRSRYQILAVGVRRDGTWVLDPTAVNSISQEAASLPSPDKCGVRVGIADIFPAGEATVAFPLLHGQKGEDGAIQGLFESIGVPYVGAGVLGSSVCMDKVAAKSLLDSGQIAQTPWEWLPAARAEVPAVREIASKLGFPMYVKPANSGSSIGISKVKSDSGLVPAIELASKYDDAIVFEADANAREIEVAVLGGIEPKASVPGEIVPKSGFYDFEEKYLADSAELKMPADLSAGKAEEAQRLAIEVFQTLRVEGMARVDLFLRPDGQFLVNEVNTIPGFTTISMYPKLWELSGISQGELLDELVQIAIKRFERRRGFLLR